MFVAPAWPVCWLPAPRPAIVHAQTTLRWRIASSFPKSLDTLFGVCDVFAKHMSDMSGGKFTITTHAAGELMPALGVLDGVSNGTVEMANTASVLLLRQGSDLRARLRHSVRPERAPDERVDGRRRRPELLREFYAKVNIINFPMGNTGAQMGGWYRKEIKSVADLKGLKFRVGGFGGKVIEKLGVVPRTSPAARSIRRWKRAPSTRPSGSAPTTT